MTTPRPAASAPDRPAVLSRLPAILAREAAIWIGLSIAITTLITVMMAGRHGMSWKDWLDNFVYSACIGFAVQALIEVGRWGFSGWLLRRDPDNPALRAHWPGWRLMGAWIPLSAVAGYLIGAAAADQLSGLGHLSRVLQGNVTPLAITATLTLLVSLATSYYFYTKGRLEHAEASAQAERRHAAEHQLKLLESQLEPHMLFNTLANLRVLIALDPPRAQQMLDRLITFLRGTLGASLAREHALATEFARIEDYLALMQIRMGPRLQVSLDLPQHLADAPVPTLLLQPVVENAIKHGLEPQVEGGHLRVQAQDDGRQLVLTVTDNGRGLDDAAQTLDGRSAAGQGSGFGMNQVRQRLETLYGPHASVALQAGDGGIGARVVIRLPLQSAATHPTPLVPTP
jgi:signal transduction histidine kinase